PSNARKSDDAGLSPYAVAEATRPRIAQPTRFTTSSLAIRSPFPGAVHRRSCRSIGGVLDAHVEGPADHVVQAGLVAELEVRTAGFRTRQAGRFLVERVSQAREEREVLRDV